MYECMFTLDIHYHTPILTSLLFIALFLSFSLLLCAFFFIIFVIAGVIYFLAVGFGVNYNCIHYVLSTFFIYFDFLGHWRYFIEFSNKYR